MSGWMAAQLNAAGMIHMRATRSKLSHDQQEQLRVELPAGDASRQLEQPIEGICAGTFLLTEDPTRDEIPRS